MSATDSRYEDSSAYDETGNTRTDQDAEGRDSVLNDGPVLLPVDPDKTDDTSSALPDHDPVVDNEESGETRHDFGRGFGAEPVGGEVKDLDDTRTDDDEVKDLDAKDLDEAKIEDDTSTFGDSKRDEENKLDGTTSDAAFTTDSSGVTTDSTGVASDSASTSSDAILKPDGDDVVSDTGSTTDSTDSSDVTTDSTATTVGPDTETGALKDPVADVPVVAVPGAGVTGTTPAATPGTSTSDLAAEWLELQGRFVDDPQAAVKEAGAKVEQALSDLRSRIENGSTEDLRTAFRRYRDLHAGLS